MNLKRNLQAISLLTVILLAGCRKHDWTTVPGGRSNCELVSVTSRILSGDGGQELPLFTKTFVPETYKLDSFFFHIRTRFNYPAYPHPQIAYAVEHQAKRMIVRKNDSEIAVFRFDNSGRLTTATDQMYGIDVDYQFVYKNGLLKEIYQDAGDGNFLWYTPAYDNTGKNLVNERFVGGPSITYSFHPSKKVKGQFLADFTHIEHQAFMALLKYLNLVPELNSERLITAVAVELDDEYPFNHNITYSNHTFDAAGRVTGYRSSSHYFEPPVEDEMADWTLNWDCIK